MSYFDEYLEYVRDVVEPEMQAVNAYTKVEVEVHANVPGFEASADSEAVQLAKQLSGQNTTEVAPYAAESGQYQKAGFSVAMCGPGSIDQAHQPNEYISVDQLEQGTEFIRRLIDLQSM